VEIRSFNVMRLLSRSFDVTALCFFRRATRGTKDQVAASVEGLSQCGHVEVFPIPQEFSRFRLGWDHLRSMAFQRVYTLDAYDSTVFRDRLRHWVSNRDFDLVHMDSLDLSTYLPDLTPLPVVVTHHNVESDLLHRRAEGATSFLFRRYLRLQAELMAKEERAQCPHVALNVAVSDADATRLTELAPGSSVFVLPNGVDTKAFVPSERNGEGIVFVGGASWYPNQDAMEYFGESILPLIREAHPGIDMTWVGRADAALERRFWNRFGIRLTGYVEDIRQHVHGAAVYVVPLRVGGGSRLKILDAWAMGMAVVSTSIGCEGLDAVNGQNLLIRDEPQEFAGGVIDLLNDQRLRTALGRGARATAVAQYDWDVLGSVLTDRYDQVLNETSVSQ
jgi:glycosyltransferase involved in cell wall biosynthesis